MHAVPLISHPFVVDPSQFLVPAAQFVHAPAVQVCVCAVHGDAALHVPLGLQVCTPFPEHWVDPGVQTPVHAPMTHAEAVHVAPASH